MNEMFVSENREEKNCCKFFFEIWVSLEKIYKTHYVAQHTPFPYDVFLWIFFSSTITIYIIWKPFPMK